MVRSGTVLFKRIGKLRIRNPIGRTDEIVKILFVNEIYLRGEDMKNPEKLTCLSGHDCGTPLPLGY